MDCKCPLNFRKELTLMKRQIEKIMTMAVAAGLMTSMLCGEVSHAAKVKTPYYKTLYL